MNLLAFTQLHPIVPYIRESDLPVRDACYLPFRKLLDYLLIYVRKGELAIVADGVGYRITEEQFCLLQPGTVHNLRATDYNETPFAHLDLFYQPDRDKSFPTKPGQTDLGEYVHLMQPRLNDFDGIRIPVVLQPRQPELYRRLMLRMIECWLSPDPLLKLSAQAAGTELVHEIIRDHTNEAGLAARSADALEWIDSYMSYHLAEPLSIQDMAKRAHLSPSRFREVFRERFGMPPHQYLVQLRLNHAKELLESTAYTLAEIAEYCGFSDVSHFSNAFKSRTGSTPGAYRHERS